MKPLRVLVAYITQAGYTRRVALAIAQRLREHGMETDVADLELCIRHPEEYDAVILGCAVRFGHHADAIATFIAEHRDVLADRPTGFFSVDRTAPTAAHTEALFRRTDWRPACVLAVPGVAGARLRRAMAWFQDRLEAKSVTHVDAPTDWARINAFADELAELVRSGTRRASR